MENKVKKSSWEKYQGEKREELFKFSDGYIDFLSMCKTEENVF